MNWLRNEQREDFPRGPIRFAISARMQASLKEHILRLPHSAWKPYREDREAVSECADVLNYWPEAEDDKQFGPLRFVAIRIRKRQGELFADGAEAKHFAVVSNVWEWEAQRLLEWHRVLAFRSQCRLVAFGGAHAQCDHRAETHGAAGILSHRAAQTVAISDLQHGGPHPAPRAPRTVPHRWPRLARLDAPPAPADRLNFTAIDPNSQRSFNRERTCACTSEMDSVSLPIFALPDSPVLPSPILSLVFHSSEAPIPRTPAPYRRITACPCA
jgi:hypothetical protein